jgi:hypothetical protein
LDEIESERHAKRPPLRSIADGSLAAGFDEHLTKPPNPPDATYS